MAEVQYKTTENWFKEYEKTIIWNDPDLKIEWPIDKLEGLKPKLSIKDLNAGEILLVAGRHGVHRPVRGGHRVEECLERSLEQLDERLLEWILPAAA